MVNDRSYVRRICTVAAELIALSLCDLFIGQDPSIPYYNIFRISEPSICAKESSLWWERQSNYGWPRSTSGKRNTRANGKSGALNRA